MATAPLGPAEMDADALRFFATLDSDATTVRSCPRRSSPTNGGCAGNPGQFAMARSPRHARPRKSDEAKWLRRLTACKGAARYALLNMPQPVAAADANFDRAVTTDEFRRAAAQRFQLLDSNGDRQLDLAEFRPLPLPDKAQKRAKFTKDPRDTRSAIRCP